MFKSIVGQFKHFIRRKKHLSNIFINAIRAVGV